VAALEARIDALTAEALDAAKELPLTAEAQVALAELATYVSQRAT
jgi:hypothetical protein